MKPSDQLRLVLKQTKELEYQADLMHKVIELGKTNGDLNDRGHLIVSMLRESGINDIYIAELFKVNIGQI